MIASWINQFTKNEVKSDKNSSKFREEGNNYYRNNDFLNAIKSYNKALNFAETKQMRAFVYANRSAAYLETKKYKECLQNIKLARENDYPAKKIKTLDEREQKCLNLMMEAAKLKEDPRNNPWHYIKLSYPANPKIPWVINDLKVRATDDNAGHGIFAKRDLNIGDIICIEDISLFYLENEEYYKHCANCFETNMLNLMPCLKSAKFMYCSNECRDEFYKYANFSGKQFDKPAIYSGKLESAFGGIDKIFTYINNVKPSDTFFDLDFTNPEENRFNAYKSIYMLYKNVKPNLIWYNFIIPITAPEGCFHVETCTCKTIVLGHGISAFQNYLKPSCIPNVFCIFIGKKLIFIVRHPIKANEQLTFAFAGEFHCHDISKRRSILSMQNISCECIACERNLTMRDVKPSNVLLILLADQTGYFTNKKFRNVREIMKQQKKWIKMLKGFSDPFISENMILFSCIYQLYYMLAINVMYPVKFT